MALAEQMAIAILRGDEAAAASLADLLRDEHGEGAKGVPPIKTLTVTDPSRLRVLLTTHESLGTDVEITDPDILRTQVQNWLLHGEILILTGFDLTLYELPNLQAPLTGTISALPAQGFMTPGEFEQHILGRQAALATRHPDTDLGENG